MKKMTNKFFAVVLSAMMSVSVFSAVPAYAAEVTTATGETTTAVTGETTTAVAETTTTSTTKVAYVTIEKFTIGQGFVLEPTKVEFTEGDTVLQVVDKTAKAEGIELVYSAQQKDYLTAIKKADNGKLDIPKEISEMGDFESYGKKYPAPTKENVRMNTGTDGLLAEYTYTDMAGWFYFVNNESLSTSASNVKVKDGDVIRVQFSIYGWGLDLGCADWTTGKKKIDLVNKDELIKELAAVKKSDISKKSANGKTIVDAALKVAAKYNPTKEEVTAAVSALKIVENVFEDGKKAQKEADAQTTKAAAPTPGKTVVKKIKNVKGCKAKITLRAVSGTSGYELRYATNKKLKNAVCVFTKKTSVTTAKFAKKKTVYAKVRTYIKKDGACYFGKWSAVKSVKIKK